MRADRKTIIGGSIAAALALVVGLVWWQASDSSSDDDRTAATSVPGVPTESSQPAETTAAPAASTTTAVVGSGVLYEAPPASTLIATLTKDIPGFKGPDGAETGTIAATWHDRPKALPVIEQRPGWLHVRLPERPNGSTAWIRTDDVEVTATPYRIMIDVATMRLRLYEAGEVTMDVPAGIGTDEAPTTVGDFFVTFLQEPPDTTSGWGPFVVVTSAHSETISDFQSSGDAIAAIHGPLGAAERIGTTGAKVSHGCVRLHLEDLEKLRVLPAGTPVDVIDSSADA